MFLVDSRMFSKYGKAVSVAVSPRVALLFDLSTFLFLLLLTLSVHQIKLICLKTNFFSSE